MMHILQEVYTYLQTVVYATRTVKQSRHSTEAGLFWQVNDVTTNEVLLIKQCVFLGNKSDLVQDDEVIAEIKQLVAHTVASFMDTKEIQKIASLIFVVSAGSQQ